MPSSALAGLGQVFVWLCGQMLYGKILHGQMLHGQMLNRQMLHGQMELGLAGAVDELGNTRCLILDTRYLILDT